MSYWRLQDPESYPLQYLPVRSAAVAPTTAAHDNATGPEEHPNQINRGQMSNSIGPGTGSRWSLRIRTVFSYAPDWALCIILAAIFFALDSVEGFKRQFSLQDTSLRHTYTVHERVPDWALYIIFAVAPLVLMPIINLLSVRSWWDLHSSWLGWLLGASITGAITQFSKITVGRPRPDVIDRCQPMAGAADPSLGLSTVAVCTQTDVHILRDGWRSFPSGHSSLSFAGLGFLAFYLAGKLHLFDEKGHAVKAWISLVPLAGAALVAISRTMDYRHHWQDVLTGSTLGIVVAYFAYRQYYPPLSSPISHHPYPQRLKRGGREHPAHKGAPALERMSLDNEGMHPRQAETRYSDRIGDEEMAMDATLHPTSSSNVDAQGRHETL